MYDKFYIHKYMYMYTHHKDKALPVYQFIHLLYIDMYMYRHRKDKALPVYQFILLHLHILRT